MLVLDEATSALDAENQRRVREAVRKLRGSMTVVIMAHRLSTICDADQVIVLDAGRIVETGTFDELAENPDSRLRLLIQADERAKAA